MGCRLDVLPHACRFVASALGSAAGVALFWAVLPITATPAARRLTSSSGSGNPAACPGRCETRAAPKWAFLLRIRDRALKLRLFSCRRRCRLTRQGEALPMTNPTNLRPRSRTGSWLHLRAMVVAVAGCLAASGAFGAADVCPARGKHDPDCGQHNMMLVGGQHVFAS